MRTKALQLSDTTVLNMLADAITINSSITPAYLFEGYERTVNDILLRTVLSGILPGDSTDFANLLYIGNLCPYISGLGVSELPRRKQQGIVEVFFNSEQAAGNSPQEIKARVLLSALTDTIDFPDDQFCKGPPQKNEEDIKMENQNAVNVYPNPANQEVTFSIQQGAISIIRIYDNLGSLVNSIKPSKHERQFNLTLTGQHAGLYYYLILDRSGHAFSGKFTIVR